MEKLYKGLLMGLFFIVITPIAAYASISFDSQSSGSNSGSSSLTYTHTTAGSDRALFVGVLTDGTVTGVTYNEVSMNLVNSVNNFPTGNNEYLYYLPNPSSGSNSVVVSTSASATIQAESASYTGVNQFGQPEQNNTGTTSGSSLLVSVTTTTDNDWLVGFFRNGSGNLTSDAGTTLRGVQSSYNIFDSNGPKSPSGSYSLSVSVSSGQTSGLVVSIASDNLSPILGSGTVNFLAKFTGSASIGKSILSDDGSNAVLTSGNLFFQDGAFLDASTTGVLGIGSTTATSIRIGRSAGTITLLAPASLQSFTFLTATGTSATTTNFFSTNSSTTALTVGSLRTSANCSSSASPAVCGTAVAGSVAMATGGSTLVVNTTAVTANSQIFVTEDSSLGTRLGITCNTTTGRIYSINARTAGTSFTIKSSANPATNKACLSYFIVN